MGIFFLLQKNCSPLKCLLLNQPSCSEDETLMYPDGGGIRLHWYCPLKCPGPAICVPKD